MRGAVVGAVLILVLPAAAADPPPTGRNAALQYLMAFEQFPRIDPQNDLPRRVAEGWLTIPFDPEVLGYLSVHQSSLTFLHRGADLPECVWPSQLNVGRDGIGVLRSEGKARQLGLVACLRARYRFEKGHPKTALDDLFATLRLARHVGDGGGMINLFIERAVADAAIRCAADHVWALGDEAAKDFLHRWDALPPPTTLAAALRTEGEQLAEGLATRGADFASPPETDLLGRGTRRPRADKLGTTAYIAGRESEAESVRQFVAAVRREHGRAAEIARLPLAEVKEAEAAWLKGLQGNVAKDDRIVWLLVAQPPYQVYRQRLAEERTTATRVMLRAAVAARVRGDALPTDRDPHGDGPFRCTRTDDGYELESALSRVAGDRVFLRVRTAEPVR
jgi:hypothetical protein